jgi:hypothetical protein
MLSILSSIKFSLTSPHDLSTTHPVVDFVVVAAAVVDQTHRMFDREYRTSFSDFALDLHTILCDE